MVSPDLVYGQLKKIRSWRRLVGTEQRMLCGTREMLTERLHACNLRATIQTAFVERVNLTLRQRSPSAAQGRLLRQSIAGLARRTWSIHIAPSELVPQRSCGMHHSLVSGVQEGSRSEPPLHAGRMSHCG